MFRTLTADLNGNPVASTDSLDSVCKPPKETLRWIDLYKQDEQAMRLLGDRFCFHPLTLEDCLHFDQRPKFETYDGYDFMVVHGYRVDWQQTDNNVPLELHVYIGSELVITIHDQPIDCIEQLWKRAQSDPKLMSRGTDNLIYMILDSLVDSFFPIISEIETRLNDLEDRVLTKPQQVQMVEIFNFKRLLLDLRRIVLPQRDMLAMLSREGNSHFGDRVLIYLRDVYDHALRLHNYVEAARELLSNVRDAHLWASSQRTNEIMKRLTILSAIFLPLTFVTGFFGQNFTSLPFSNDWLLYGSIGLCALLPVAMLAYFVRSKWF
jgi:magnesium transporter